MNRTSIMTAFIVAVICIAVTGCKDKVQMAEDSIKSASIETATNADTGIYRGNLSRSGVFQASGVVNTPKLRWSSNIGHVPDRVSAIVHGDSLFIGSTITKQVQGANISKINVGVVQSFDTRTGVVKWTYEIKSGYNDYLINTPTYANGSLLCITNQGLIISIDAATGMQKWTYDGTNPIHPIIYDNKAYFFEDTFFALDLESGKKVWSMPQVKDQVLGMPDAGLSLSNGTLVYAAYPNDGSTDKHIIALDIKTGKVKWRYNVKATSQESDPVVKDGVVFFGTMNTSFHALDLETGEQKWQFQTNGMISSSAAVTDQLVIFGSYDGNLYALDTKTGKEKWKYNTGIMIYASPSVANELVYFGDGNGVFYAINVNDGKQKWKYQVQDLIKDTSIIQDGVVYFTDNQNEYALEESKQSVQATDNEPATKEISESTIIEKFMKTYKINKVDLLNPIRADLNNDGTDELIIASDTRDMNGTGHLAVYDKSGLEIANHNVDAAAGDVQLDLKVIVNAKYKKCLAVITSFRQTGAEILCMDSGSLKSIQNFSGAKVEFVDLDNDGYEEVKVADIDWANSKTMADMKTNNIIYKWDGTAYARNSVSAATKPTSTATDIWKILEGTWYPDPDETTLAKNSITISKTSDTAGQISYTNLMTAEINGKKTFKVSKTENGAINIEIDGQSITLKVQDETHLEWNQQQDKQTFKKIISPHRDSFTVKDLEGKWLSLKSEGGGKIQFEFRGSDQGTLTFFNEVEIVKYPFKLIKTEGSKFTLQYSEDGVDHTLNAELTQKNTLRVVYNTVPDEEYVYGRMTK